MLATNYGQENASLPKNCTHGCVIFLAIRDFRLHQ